MLLYDSCYDDESLNKTKYIFKGIPSKFKITQDFKGKTPIILDKRKSQQSHILLSYKNTKFTVTINGLYMPLNKY